MRQGGGCARQWDICEQLWGMVSWTPVWVGRGSLLVVFAALSEVGTLPAASNWFCERPLDLFQVSVSQQTSKGKAFPPCTAGFFGISQAGLPSVPLDDFLAYAEWTHNIWHCRNQ